MIGSPCVRTRSSRRRQHLVDRAIPVVLPSESPSSAATELDRLRCGDAGAINHLVERHRAQMLSVARRFFPCEHDAADAVQDAFVSAIQALPRFEGDSQIGTWLHRITVNACLMKLRAKSRRPSMPLRSKVGPPDGADPGDPSQSEALVVERIISDETRQRVRDCIHRLPASYRDVVQLRDLDEHDTQTTADRLKISPVAVKTRLHRARMALKQLLLEIGMDSCDPS